MTGEQFSQHGFFDSVKNNDSCSKYIVFKELISAMKKRLDFLTSIFLKNKINKTWNEASWFYCKISLFRYTRFIETLNCGLARIWETILIFKIWITSQVVEEDPLWVVHDGLRYVNGDIGLEARGYRRTLSGWSYRGCCCWGFGGILHSRGNATSRSREERKKPKRTRRKESSGYQQQHSLYTP